MEKMINLCENTKNKILTAEGILLLLCVLLPATALLCQVGLTVQTHTITFHIDTLQHFLTPTFPDDATIVLNVWY